MQRCTRCGVDRDADQFWSGQSYCRPCNREYAREKHERRPAYALLRGARSRARAKGLTFLLREEDITIPTHCPVLGMELARAVGSRGQAANSPTLDRIDSAKGYTPANVRVISWRANRLKSDATLEELRRVLAYFEESSQSAW